MPPPDDLNTNPGNEPRWFQIVGSVLSAAIGIQSGKNHARDFKHGKLAVFVLAGVVFVATFILTVYTIVRVVLQQATY